MIQSKFNEIEVRESIQAALDALPAKASRRDKTLLVANLLLIDHGIYPSAKVVHDHTSQGSMTDINRDLRDFWTEVRKKMRVQLNAPFIPDELATAFGEGLAKIWGLAQHAATQHFEGAREQCRLEVQGASEARVGAERDRDRTLERLALLEAELLAERERRGEAERRVAAQAGEIAGLQGSLSSWQQKLEVEAIARHEAEARFSRELELERAERVREADRFTGEINFAKRQIDTARVAEKEMREQLNAEKGHREREVATYRQRMNSAEEASTAAKGRVAELRAQTASLEGRVAELQDRVRELAKAGVARISARPAPLKRKPLRRS
ncbi:DNA-binding protein [Acidovorax sp. sic0104]|uniref:DNA-binding protein n=1 Tax=Acidovorax sp. sic0104 TaxID=2854784 RepID=UPI001C47005A|nr:DNA-binding protein [Acidovorax sp. sic0104]MBV7541953.1 DNA-binding protein [Acidovorax sp. sic0104]